ncbi:Hypothetical_protein [Hexamita inflata]|uniref:Hypothetical_protein n=1 Tax=Hexamita inflata TaxID=28002 RepID=A0ABP1LSH7_9EUKA
MNYEFQQIPNGSPDRSFSPTIRKLVDKEIQGRKDAYQRIEIKQRLKRQIDEKILENQTKSPDKTKKMKIIFEKQQITQSLTILPSIQKQTIPYSPAKSQSIQKQLREQITLVMDDLSDF